MSRTILVYHHFQPPPSEALADAEIAIELHPGEARIVKDRNEEHQAILLTANGRMDEERIAERALDRLCDDGDPERTAQRIADFQREFALGALSRLGAALATQFIATGGEAPTPEA